MGEDLRLLDRNSKELSKFGRVTKFGNREGRLLTNLFKTPGAVVFEQPPSLFRWKQIKPHSSGTKMAIIWKVTREQRRV